MSVACLALEPSSSPWAWVRGFGSIECVQAPAIAGGSGVALIRPTGCFDRIVSLSPQSVLVAPQQTASMDLRFDARGLLPGDYPTTIRFLSTTPRARNGVSIGGTGRVAEGCGKPACANACAATKSSYRAT